MIVLGIDPGLQATGMVWLAGGAIVAAETMRGRPPKRGFANLQAACRTMADRVLDTAAAGPRVDLIAIEGWENQGIARARGAERHHVPVLLGAIAALLPVDARLIPAPEVVWQSASEVLGPRGYGWLMKSGVRPSIRGWAQLVTNEHLRSAACHALHADAMARQLTIAAV